MEQCFPLHAHVSTEWN